MRAAVSGVLAGALTLGVATLLAGALSRISVSAGQPSPVIAVGGAFVDRTPLWLKNFAVSTFGTNDKQALFAGMALVLVAVCAGVGVLAARRRTAGLVAFAVVGALGAAAVLSRPGARPLDVAPDAGRHARGSLGADHPARRWARAPRRAATASTGAGCCSVGRGSPPWPRRPPRSGRGSGAGRARWRRPARTSPSRRCRPRWWSRLRPPSTCPASRRTSCPNATSTGSTRRSWCPRWTPGDWRLRVHGLVDQEVEIDWDDLGGQADAAGAGHPDLRLQRGRRRPRRQRRLDRVADPRAARPGRATARSRHGALDERRRLHRRHAARGAHRRPQRAAGRRP